MWQLSQNVETGVLNSDVEYSCSCSLQILLLLTKEEQRKLKQDDSGTDQWLFEGTEKDMESQSLLSSY